MFPLFFMGMLGADWFTKLLNGTSNNTNSQTNNVMVNRVNDDVIKALAGFIKVYEGYESKAYNLGDGKITIGYGTTQWLNSSGNVVRAVRMGDTITETVALQQLHYFFIKVIPQLNQYLAISSVTVPANFLASLLNFCYMSGGGFLNWSSTKAMILKVNRNSNLSSVAFTLKTDMVNAYKSLKTNATERARYGQNKTHKWQIYGLGWSRRIQASADLIEGKMKKESWYVSNIKKAF